MDKVTLVIAEFTISVNFRPIRREDRRIIRSEFIKLFISRFKDFIVESPGNAKRADMTIVFAHQEEHKVKVDSIVKTFFLETFTFINNKKIIGNYQLNVYQIQLLLREAIQILMQQNNGFMLHTSAVLVNNEAYLFMGRSGAGKSTITSLLSTSYKPLADDTLIIRKVRNVYYAFQTPFIEKDHQFPKDLKKYSVRKLFYLRKSHTNKAIEIRTESLVISKLSAQLFTSRDDYGVQMKSLLEFISKDISSYILYFINDEKKLLDFFKLLSNNK